MTPTELLKELRSVRTRCEQELMARAENRDRTYETIDEAVDLLGSLETYLLEQEKPRATTGTSVGRGMPRGR